MPPKTRRPSYDPYAAHRCHCKHLVYADDDPGGECRFCACVNHFSDARPGTDSLHDTDSRFEQQGVSGYGP